MNRTLMMEKTNYEKYSRECRNKNGTAVSQCAEGYGVCCICKYTFHLIGLFKVNQKMTCKKLGIENLGLKIQV